MGERKSFSLAVLKDSRGERQKGGKKKKPRRVCRGPNWTPPSFLSSNLPSPSESLKPPADTHTAAVRAPGRQMGCKKKKKYSCSTTTCEGCGGRNKKNQHGVGCGDVVDLKSVDLMSVTHGRDSNATTRELNTRPGDELMLSTRILMERGWR